MEDEAVYMVMELWIIPGTFDRLKLYRKQMNAILDKYQPEYVFHNHAFEWLVNEHDEALPVGIEIVKFKNEQTARAMFAEVNASELKKMEKEIFSRIRCYLSRHAFPDAFKKEMGL